MKLPYTGKFIIVHHKAKRAGDHRDIRFTKPDGSNVYDSFACRKDIPLEVNKRVMIVKTHDHSEKEAMYLGTIETGYGAGVLDLWDKGKCTIYKYSSRHIVIEFFGKKIKGIYHILGTGVASRNFKDNTFFFFKGKAQTYTTKDE